MSRETSPLQRTPLHGVHLEEGGRLIGFGGWEMPVQYSGISAEHLAVRQGAGLFDVSHMGRIAVRGRGARAFLEYLLPARVSAMEPGRLLYTALCNEQGGTLDDLLVYCLGQAEYLLVVNAARRQADWEWLGRLKGDRAGVELEDLSAAEGMIALQGPRAEALAVSLAGQALHELGYYRCCRTRMAGIEVLISRSGYTGEDGFEIICASHGLEPLWRALRRAGALPCGLGARDTLRTEMGFCLYGHELSEQITPLEAGLAWTLALDKEEDFVGKAALRAQKEEGPRRRLRGFRLLEKGIPRPGQRVLGEPDRPVGQVSSGTFSPTLQQGIGLAFVERPFAKEGAQVYIDAPGRPRPARLERPPLVPSRVKKQGHHS